MKDPRIINNIKFTRRPKHSVPAMRVIRSVANKFDGLITFKDLDELIFNGATTFNATSDEMRKSFVDEINRLADGTFILGTWKSRIEDLEDEPAEEDTDD